ncbi:signal recognition particle 14 kDa protein-like [Ornithodoros turicata]|uniref:signal recognition particle 14 kDa protein-like n=1 Tax=Ornithodoros turicata TaxID=34597 RepID=UPI003139459C
MVLLENDSFLCELTKLFQKYRTTGSVYVTMKRYDGKVKPKPRPERLASNPVQPPAEYKCLLRAHAGNKKISTVINAKDVNKFQQAYVNLLKANIDGLKKKDKKKSTTKATQ